MQAWKRLWQNMSSHSVRQAWGLTSDGHDWVLVGLAPQRSEGIKLHTFERIVTSAKEQTLRGFSEGLAQLNIATSYSGRRLNVGLKSEDMVAGILELPANLSPDECAAEVQLEVSQLLGLAPEEVGFDFQSIQVNDVQFLRIDWVGCDRAIIKALKNNTRSAGWQLHTVEPAWHAAHRAVSQLKGGITSLLTQSPQDWQFDWPKLAQTQDVAAHERREFGPDSALRQAMQSAAGPRLVASGLALKAWL